MTAILRKFAWLMLAPLVLAGCFHDGSDEPFYPNCTTAGQNRFVYDVMRDWYYWYELVPDIDPSNYASPDDVLQAVRFNSLDSSFSYLTTVEAEQAFLDNSAYIGFGFSTTILNGDELYLREAFAGAPAATAGMARGDRILEIDGTPVASLIAADTLQDAYGPAEIGISRDFLVEHPDTSQELISVSKDEVEVPVVVGSTTFDVNGSTTGYLFFRSFNNASYAALDNAFSQFSSAGVTKLVLDLRYNGGGLISVAEYLGSLISGSTNTGDVLATMQFNARHQDQNIVLRLYGTSLSLPITDLVVITTASTASASELIVNGLDPHINVQTVGATTYGKPVGQSGFQFCDKVLRPVTFETVNANGVGGYYNGIAPTCAATDDLSEPIGSQAEASVQEAVNLLSTGSCSAASPKMARELAWQKAVSPPARQEDGWQVVLGGAR